MKKLLTILVLFIVPVSFFIIAGILKNSQGPFYSSYQYDPNYAYLISSLNLSQLSGFGVVHIDHPGTPVQVIGAVIIKLYSYINGSVNMVQDVLMNPEKYIEKIDLTLIVINCVGLFLLGIITYKVYSNMLIALLMQLTPFTSFNVILWFSLVGPENFLVFVSSIFLAVLILYLNVPETDNRKHLIYTIALGLICGLGIATKLTFFPLTIIPFILVRGIKFKLLFLSVILFSFLIFVFPAISSENTGVFVNWVYNLFIHTKKYGSGDPTIIDPLTFLHNVKTTLFLEWFFDLAYISIFISLIMCLLPKFKNKFVKDFYFKLTKSDNVFVNDNKFRLALGIFLAMTLQIVIVAKHYKANYMFPSLIICTFAIFTSVSILAGSFGWKLTKGKKNLIYLILIVIISAYGIITANRFGNNLRIRKDEAIKFINYTEGNFDNMVKVFYAYPPTGREFGLKFGVAYAGSQKNNYDSILYAEYPNSIFYYQKFTSFSNDTTSIEKSFKSADKIMLYCWEETQPDTFIEMLKKDYGVSKATAEKKFSSRSRELVYEIRIEK